MYRIIKPQRSISFFSLNTSRKQKLLPVAIFKSKNNNFHSVHIQDSIDAQTKDQMHVIGNTE